MLLFDVSAIAQKVSAIAQKKPFGNHLLSGTAMQRRPPFRHCRIEMVSPPTLP